MNYYFAATSTDSSESAGLFQALGIDVQLLVVQIASFLILLAILNKFVFPHLLKAIDKRQASIESASKAAEEAAKSAEKAEAKTAEEFKKAKKEAADIVALANKESAAIVEEAEAKASKKAEHLIQQAEARIESDLAQAHEQLRAELGELVAQATEKIIGEKLDSKKDAALIEQALKAARKQV